MECHSNLPGQFAHNVGKNRPRVMYGACKVLFRDQLKLEIVLEDIIYTCEMDLQECIPADITDDEIRNHFFFKKQCLLSSNYELIFTD